MRRLIIVCIVAFLLASSIRASDLALCLTVKQKSAIIGEPVEIILEIKGKGEFTLPSSFSVCDGHTRINWSDAQRTKPPSGFIEAIPCAAVLKGPFDSKGMTKYCGIASSSYLVTFKKAGHYVAKVNYESVGPYLDRYSPSDIRPVNGIWEGKLESNEIEIEVANPTGIDKEAYEYFKGSPLSNPTELLKNYPTSTYAAYAIYDRLRGFAQADFGNPRFLKSLETGVFLSNSYPTEAGWIWFKGEDNAAWWSKWTEIILKNHPDIWFADELRLKVAINQVALKKYKEGEAELEKLSKEAKPYIAEKAEKFLDLMKQKGWIVDQIKENEKPVPAPKTSPTETK